MTAVPIALPERPQAATLAQAVFDRPSLVERLGGDEGLLTEIVSMFADQAAGLVNDILAARAAGDLVTLRREAHTLKGAAANVGAAQLAALGEKLERFAEAGDLDGVGRLELLLQTALDAFVELVGR